MRILNFLKSRTFLTQIGLLVLVIVLLVFGLKAWLKSTTNHGDFIEVPDLAKKSVLEVRQLVEANNLRFEVLDSANYNPDYPRFSITSQNPKAGSKVKKNRMIYVKVNPANYKKVTIPNVIQVTRRNAESKLRAVGLVVNKVTYIDQIGEDMVYYIKYKGKNVNDGDRLHKMSKVEFVCGNGNISNSARIKAEAKEDNGGA
jgi:beta-lactam-binding protein with PASTA domain